MNTLTKIIGAALIVAVLGLSLSACQKQEGPAERAGKEVDQAAEKVGQKIEKIGDDIQNAAKSDK